MNNNDVQLAIIADKFSKSMVVIRTILRATWFWLFFALVLYVNTDWNISFITPILLLLINLITVLYKYFVQDKEYLDKIIFHDSCVVLVYGTFNNLVKSTEIKYKKLRFTYYNKVKIEYFYAKAPITLSIYDGESLVDNIRDGEFGWKIEQLEKLYDEILLRTLPYTKDLKPEIPVKIKGTSKRRKQFPNTRPYCE